MCTTKEGDTEFESKQRLVKLTLSASRRSPNFIKLVIKFLSKQVWNLVKEFHVTHSLSLSLFRKNIEGMTKISLEREMANTKFDGHCHHLQHAVNRHCFNFSTGFALVFLSPLLPDWHYWVKYFHLSQP